MKKIIEIEISEIQVKILQELHMDYEMCVGYSWLDHIADKKTLEKEIKFLKAIGFVETYHGLMDDDGMVAGSGFCRTELANRFMEKYEL